MRPEDGLARLLAVLDRLPCAARRALTVLLPLVLLGALVASLVLSPRAQHNRAGTSASHGAPAWPTVEPTPTSELTSGVGGDLGGGSVAAAVDPARAFIESYVAFSYGHARLRAIRSADPGLVRSFAGRHARVTLALRKRHPQVVALRVAAFSPGVARATAVVADGPIRYPLVFFLDRRPGGWRVTRMAG
jgi:hypothetical protein